ncbi:chaperone protein ClpB [Acrasis kona]|uniref:Chaperone protein ClpB n=1 Tax=Acrasis kona TaxID=1008807 RepID=A0AAW2YY15_9EUKA
MSEKTFEAVLGRIQSIHNKEIQKLQQELKNIQTLIIEENEGWNSDKKDLVNRQNIAQQKLNAVNKQYNLHRMEAKLHYNNYSNLKSKISHKRPTSGSPSENMLKSKRAKTNSNQSRSRDSVRSTPMTIIDLDDSQLLASEYSDDDILVSQNSTVL